MSLMVERKGPVEASFWVTVGQWGTQNIQSSCSKPYPFDNQSNPPVRQLLALTGYVKDSQHRPHRGIADVSSRWPQRRITILRKVCWAGNREPKDNCFRSEDKGNPQKNQKGRQPRKSGAFPKSLLGEGKQDPGEYQTKSGGKREKILPEEHTV